jgi:hypothetical protein
MAFLSVSIRVYPWLKILSALAGRLHPKKIKQLAIIVKTAGLFKPHY